MTADLHVRGARQHNLQNIDVRLPRDRLIVVTGPSGSGKSSLVFDTIYAEGQRRYVESLSAYARQFLHQMPKPDVDFIEGLSPAIAIQQQSGSRNPRSTVGTVTEIYDYLRLLFARVGVPHCPTCRRVIEAHTVQQMVDRVLALGEGARFAVHAPMVRARKGDLDKEIARLRKEGFVRVVIDGEPRDLGQDVTVDPKKAHDLEVQVDRLSVKSGVRQRLTEAVELALSLGDGLVHVVPQQGQTLAMSERLACPEHGVALAELTPRTFSFNSPEGACPKCAGLGEERRFDPDRIVPDPSLSLDGGAIDPWGKAGGPFQRTMLWTMQRHLPGVPLDVPWKKLKKKQRDQILGGGEGWEGVLASLERRAREYEARKREQGDAEGAIEFLEEELGQYLVRSVCAECGGARLRKEALAVTIADRNIRELTCLALDRARAIFDALAFDGWRKQVAAPLVREIRERLGFLVDVGLGYLSLDRTTGTLSGGEAQRIRLATQIGSALVGVLYVLDEPSIGLHARDNERLLRTLGRLRDLGNTVLVVEHDAETIRSADHVLDRGPGAGRLGGRIVAQGTPEEIRETQGSSTGAYLAGRRGMPTPAERRAAAGWLVLSGVRTHNLKDVEVRLPLGTLVCVTGVSGSGKSSLIVDTLLPILREQLHGAKIDEVQASLTGLEQLEKVVAIDQAPIGRTPRSNPATYSGLFSDLRDLFASLPESRARGYKPVRFSFTVKGGRCEACAGDGVLRVSMHFLPDVYVTCEECSGRRYNRETLEIRYRGYSIADVLDMPVEQALELFEVIPKLRDKLRTLASVGLGYVHLGQPATTLSGGEAQRLKLAKELARRESGKTLYVLDEPTTGLHFSDVEVLMKALDDLVERGNTVLVIEHELDVIRMADHLIDLGPEGGDGGGRVVATGTPEQIAEVASSHTGRYLASVLAAHAEPK